MSCILERPNDVRLLSYFPRDCIAMFRKGFCNDSYALAMYVASNPIYEQGKKNSLMASYVTFISSVKCTIKIKDYIHNRIKEHPCFSVVYLGDYVMDILNSDNLIKTKTYLDTLRQLNKEQVELVPNSRYSYWFDYNMSIVVPTIRDMYKGGLLVPKRNMS